MGFADEDFEDFVRTISAPHVSAARARVAERFLQRHDFDEYAAMHLAAGLYAAGRGKELLSIIERETQPRIVADPILRREVGFHRLQTAMQVSAESSDEASNAANNFGRRRSHAWHRHSIAVDRNNPDLAAMFMGESAVRTLLMDSRAKFLTMAGSFYTL